MTTTRIPLWRSRLQVAALTAFALWMPAVAHAQDAPKSPVAVADMYLDAYLRSKPDAVPALVDYLKAGGISVDDAELTDIPDTLVATIHDQMLKETEGPDAESKAGVDAVARALRTALKRVQCHTVPDKTEQQDSYAADVAFSCTVPEIRTVLAYMSDDQLKGGRAKPLQHFVAAGAIGEVTATMDVPGKLHMKSDDGSVWVTGYPDELVQALIVGILAPSE